MSRIENGKVELECAPADLRVMFDEISALFSGRRVLLVEDNAINMEIAKMILEQKNFQVKTAENGREAVDKVSASRPGTYDAILMDIQMPVMDGYAATRAIRALPDRELASVPIIAVTANAFEEDRKVALEAGMNGHLAKPYDVEQMMTALADILHLSCG